MQILRGENFSPLMMKELVLFPGFPQHSQIILCMSLRDAITVCRYTVVVKRQAEEVWKRAQDKLRAQGNYKHKTRAIKKSALGNKKQEDVRSNLRLS